MNKLKKALRSKTVIFGIVLAALSALQGFVLAVEMEPKTQALIGFALSVIIIILRFLTTSSIDDK